MRARMYLLVPLLLVTLLWSSPVGATSRMVSAGLGECRDIALTYDVEFSATTQALADTIDELGIKTTWFFTGYTVGENAALVRQVAARHQIGNHTYDHPQMPKLSPEGMRWQIRTAEQAIGAAAGVSPRPIFRPPYGSYNNTLREVTESEGYPYVIMWSVDTADWQRPSAEIIRQRITTGAFPGAIVLQHGFPPNTVEGTRMAVGELRARGYQFVTVTEIMGIDRHLRSFAGDTYVVQPSDNLASIARCHNVAAGRFQAYNEVTDLKAGAILRVPHTKEVIIRIDGVRQVYAVYPRIREDRTVAHIRLLERLGAKVSWEGGKVIITREGKRIVVTPGERLALVDGQPADMLAPAVIEADRVMVPVRFMVEQMGASLTWDPATWTIQIQAPPVATP